MLTLRHVAQAAIDQIQPCRDYLTGRLSGFQQRLLTDSQAWRLVRDTSILGPVLRLLLSC